MKTRPFDLSGKVALIVGGGGALGGAQAEGLARAGADIVIADLAPDSSEARLAAIRRLGRKTRFQQVNVADPDSVETLVEAACSFAGRLNIVVNSAGITQRYPSEEFDDRAFDRILDVNLHGLFYTCKAAAIRMMRNGGGRIINTASIFSFAGNPESIAYAASKGAVAQLTHTLAVEWAQYGIAVNAVAPSWFETPMGTLANDIDRMYAGASRKPAKEELHARTVGRVPLLRMGQPHEIVGATVFLASEAASMVTGHILAVDGGFLAQ